MPRNTVRRLKKHKIHTRRNRVEKFSGEATEGRLVGKENESSSTDRHIHTYYQNDYNSNDGMLTAVWGPGMWHYLHTMSFNYPIHPTPVDKRNYREFMLNLQYVLPCGKCRKNLVKNFKRLPLKMSAMKSRDTFSKYIFDLHELINKMLHKESGLTYEIIRERYEHFRARCAIPIAISPTANLEEESHKMIHSKEKGCTEPLYGEKSKCVLKIVPDHVKCNTLEIDKKCIKRRLNIPNS